MIGTCTLLTCINSHKLYVLFFKSVFIVIIIRGLRYYMYCILTNQNMSDNSFLGKNFRIPPLATALCITLSPYSPLALYMVHLFDFPTLSLSLHSSSLLQVDNQGILFGYQLVGGLFIIFWSFTFCLVLFSILWFFPVNFFLTCLPW